MEAPVKKERLFYLDFVRAIATIVIIITHYNALFLYTNPQMPQKAVISPYVANIYIGDFGVSLFLIISGAALMYVYEEKLNLLVFYKKRFLNIYPMFWIAYSAVFLIRFFEHQGFWMKAPLGNFVYTVLGMDAYVGNFGIDTFFIVGEWFFGFIIIYYLIFPLLRFGVNKVPVVMILLSLCSFVAMMYLWKYPVQPSIIIFTRLPELVFGMVFVKFRKKVAWYVALPSAAVLVVNTILMPQINNNIQTVYVGIAAFLMLVFIAEQLKNCKPLCKLSSAVCKYSYAIFIVHHVIILRVADYFDLYKLTVQESYVVFAGCCFIIIPAAILLYEAHKKVMSIFK